ncbi:MAG: response regulator [Gammaproteobacteria bacterium]
MFHFKSLSSKLIAFYIPLVSFTLICLLSVLEARHYYVHRGEIKDAQQRLIAIDRSPFAAAVWQYDTDQIQLLLRSLEIDPNLRGALVLDSLGNILGKIGNVDLNTADPQYVSEVELIYESRFHSEPVGKLILISHDEELRRQFGERLVVNSLILVVLITTLLAITLLVVRRLIITPIGRLHQAIEKMREQNIREPVRWNSDDELGQVVHAYNHMQAKRKAAEAELRKYKQQLENQVSERTVELQQNRELLTAIIDNSNTLIYVKQADGKYLMVNRAWCKLLGFDSQEVIGKSDHELFPAEMAERYRESDLKVLNTKRPVSEEEPIRLGEAEYTLISVKFPLVDSQGSCYASCGISSDITERKKLEQELILAKETAEEANRVKSQFLANMSHEIRTAMNTMIGFTTLILKTDLAEKQRNYLQKIRNSAEQLLTLINDIFEFSKIESGNLDIESTTFDLYELLDDLGDQFAEPAARKNIELIIQKGAEVPTLLRGDPLRLRQILVNLTANAIRFTEHGEVVVSVTRVKENPDSQILRFNIRDTGIGIAAEDAAKLFSSLTGTEPSTMRKLEGPGLGLALCKQLVTLMKGQIGVNSMLGQGSTFWCEIPFAPATEAGSPVRAIEPRFRIKHFLIVEDNRTTLEVLAELLHGFGFQCQTAASGEEALEILHHVKSDSFLEAVLLDADLPGIDGLETASRIRSMDSGRNLPIVMMYPFGHNPDPQVIEKIGVNGLLTKPVQRTVLFDTLVELFSERRQGTQTGNVEISPNYERHGHFSGISLLLAEDNPGNQELALNMLNDLGIQTKVVNNGFAAVEAVEKGSYDAVLMDIQMPEMDGFQATAIIRQSYPTEELPIIAMSARAMQGDRGKCIDAGMNDWIGKPIDSLALVETLYRWLGPAVPHSEPPTSPDGRLPSEERIALQRPEPLPLESLSGFDIPEALERLGNDRDQYGKLLRKFAESHADIGKRIQEQFSGGKLDAVCQLLHALQGVAGNLAATRLLAATLQLEERTRERMSGKAGREQVEEQCLETFLKVMNETLRGIERCFPEIKAGIPRPACDPDGEISEDFAKETARRIRDATFMGDLSELQSIAESLPTNSFWALEVLRLTDNFDFDGLEKLAHTLDQL